MFIGATTLLTETYTPAERAKTQAVNEFSVFTVVVGVIICGLIAASIRMGDRKYWCFAFVERGIAQRFMAQIYPA